MRALALLIFLFPYGQAAANDCAWYTSLLEKAREQCRMGGSNCVDVPYIEDAANRHCGSGSSRRPAQPAPSAPSCRENGAVKFTVPNSGTCFDFSTAPDQAEFEYEGFIYKWIKDSAYASLADLMAEQRRLNRHRPAPGQAQRPAPPAPPPAARRQKPSPSPPQERAERSCRSTSTSGCSYSCRVRAVDNTSYINFECDNSCPFDVKIELCYTSERPRPLCSPKTIKFGAKAEVISQTTEEFYRQRPPYWEGYREICP